MVVSTDSAEIAAVAQGYGAEIPELRPAAMATDEATAYDFCDELLRTKGVSEATYRAAVDRFAEGGVIDMLGVIGYFTTVSMVLNVAHTPAPKDARAEPLSPLPM